jgi:hypothetical protein
VAKNSEKQPFLSEKQLFLGIKIKLNLTLFRGQKTPKTPKNSTFFYKYKGFTNFLQIPNPL